MDQTEKNIRASFDLAKKDIIALRNKVSELVEVQEFLLRKVSKLASKPVSKAKPKTRTKKKIKKKRKKK